MKPPKILLAHPGTQHSKYLAIELFKKGLLSNYCTGLVIPLNHLLTRIILFVLPKRFKEKLNHRLIPIIPFKLLRLFPLLEIKATNKLKRAAAYKEEVFYKRNELFQQKISVRDIKSSDVVVGFDTSFWILAERAKKLNKKVILDQTTAEPSGKAEILKEVAAKYPLWHFDIESRYSLFHQTDTLEQSIADRIVVASSYSKETLVRKNVSAVKIAINPYGTDITKFSPSNDRPRLDLIKFLFVGSISALKGIPLLMEAWEKIDKTKAVLYLAGPISKKVEKLIGEQESVKILGAFPKEELPSVYQSCHVFIFPSYTEGFGQVILEAMACGLPVITTENTGGRDLISEGEEGFVIPAGSVEALEKAIKYFIATPGKINEMSEKSRTKAKEFTWEQYGDRWQKIVEEVLLSEV